MENFETYRYYDKNHKLRVLKAIRNIDDFKKVITVFRDYPYNEQLTDKDIEVEYNSYQKNGIILGCYLDGKIAGINCILDGADKNHGIKFYDEDKIAYYAGFAVNPEYRGQGIGKLLIYYSDKYLQDLKLYDYSYARILYKGSMSERIFRANNFEDAYYNNNLIIDEVSYERNNSNNIESDKRKYMVKKLSDRGHGWYI